MKLFKAHSDDRGGGLIPECSFLCRAASGGGGASAAPQEEAGPRRPQGLQHRPVCLGRGSEGAAGSSLCPRRRRPWSGGSLIVPHRLQPGCWRRLRSGLLGLVLTYVRHCVKCWGHSRKTQRRLTRRLKPRRRRKKAETGAHLQLTQVLSKSMLHSLNPGSSGVVHGH